MHTARGTEVGVDILIARPLFWAPIDNLFIHPPKKQKTSKTFLVHFLYQKEDEESKEENK